MNVYEFSFYLDTKLKSGDVVGIIVRKNQIVRPSWLDKTITPHARAKIKQQLGKIFESIMGSKAKQ